MRVIRNTGYTRAQKSRAKWLTLAGFLLFISGFGFAYLLKMQLLSYVMLVPAYILFISGMQQLGKWTNAPRRPRGDLLLDQTLKNLTDRYTMIHFVKVGETMVEHVLLYPGGALVIVLRDVVGRIELSGRRFRRIANPITRMLSASGPPLAHPDEEMDKGVAALEEGLKALKHEIDVSGVVVFTSIDHQLEEIDPDLDSIHIGDLADYVRVLDVDASFKQQDRDQIANALTTGEGFERDEPVRTRRPVVVKRRPT